MEKSNEDFVDKLKVLFYVCKDPETEVGLQGQKLLMSVSLMMIFLFFIF